MEEKVLILVPVKECSKRVPRKNLLDLCGKPLFMWALDVARQAGAWIGADVFVTTESDNVVQMLNGYFDVGIILRPLELAQDPIQLKQVCQHALERLKQKGRKYDTLIMVQPSNPFVEVEDILNCYELKKASPLYSQVRMMQKIIKGVFDCFPKTDIASIPVPKPQYKAMGVGSVLVISPFYFDLFDSKAIPYFVENEKTIDIDTEFDFNLARFLMEQREEKTNESDKARQDEMVKVDR